MRRVPLLGVLVVLLAHTSANAAIVGPCKFDTQKLAFAGTASEQASCLLRKVRILGNVDPTPRELPVHLRLLIGQPISIPKARLRKVIADRGLTEAMLGGSLEDPLSRANTNSPQGPQARYFVIHDTSSPFLADMPFPSDLDHDNHVNSLSGYKSRSNAKAHVFVNRRGDIYVGHNFNVPWRATRLESKVVGVTSRGLFIHIENVQPRRTHPKQPDGTAPQPGFSAQQYDRLALLYVAASARAGSGLIPAFHASIDEGLPGGHDDPQNFSLEDFDAAIGRLLEEARARPSNDESNVK